MAQASKTKLFFALVGMMVLVLTAGAAAQYAWWSTQPAGHSEVPSQLFVIPRGRAVRLIGQDLEDAGIIRSARAFEFAVWKLKLQSKIQASSFDLSPKDDVFTIASQLTQGTNDVWITIKEGLRAEEIGEYLVASLPNASHNDTTFTTECLQYEGQLFPETYLVPKGYTESQVCQLLRTQFESVWSELRAATPPEVSYPDEDLITLASIVEREARTPDQMKLVAGILYNRLERGMPLQVDATLQYSKGYDATRQTWWTPPTPDDKAVESPYNTYLNPGLPPGPIANPGKNALQAVLTPTATDDLFYLHASNGQMYTAPDYETHLQNIERYLR